MQKFIALLFAFLITSPAFAQGFGFLNGVGFPTTGGSGGGSSYTGGAGINVTGSVIKNIGAIFGGDGSDGAVTKGAVTETTIKQYNATTFSQTAATTYTVKSGTQINTNSTSTINGAFVVAVGMPGGGGVLGTGNNSIAPGSGLSPGQSAPQLASGGGGGGFGGDGGVSGAYTTASYGLGGHAIPLGFSYAGSGGGGAGFVSFAQGGAGGGYVRFCSAGALTIASGGSISANGSDGGNADAAAGGGSGGGIYLYSTTSITQTGNGSVVGGAGGTAANYGGGGGGGGGIYLRHSPSNTGAGTIAVTGGAAGTNGATSGASPAAGADGISISITGTPNFPLIAQHEKQINNMVALAKVQQAFGKQGQTVEWTQKDNVAYLAAIESKDQNEFQQTAFLLNNGEQLDGRGEVAQIGVGDAVELGDAV